MRFVGYLNRRPYLWFVDLEKRLVTPAAELEYIPQAIDALVPLTGGVAVRCGPYGFLLESDLSGSGRELTPTDTAELRQRAPMIDDLPSVRDPIFHLTLPDGRIEHFQHPAVCYWGFGT